MKWLWSMSCANWNIVKINYSNGNDDEEVDNAVDDDNDTANGNDIKMYRLGDKHPSFNYMGMSERNAIVVPQITSTKHFPDRYSFIKNEWYFCKWNYSIVAWTIYQDHIANILSILRQMWSYYWWIILEKVSKCHNK